MTLKELIDSDPYWLDFPAYLEDIEYFTAFLLVEGMEKRLQYHYYNAILGSYYEATYKEAFKNWLYDIKWNLYNMQKLVDAKFNPLDNYDKTSTITTTYGQTSSTTSIGQSSRTDISGARRNEQNSDAVTNTTTSKVSPMDVTTFQNDTQDTSDLGATKVVTTDASVTDTHNDSGRNDTTTALEHIDSVIEHTRGNIGVTTSAKMAEEMFDLIEYRNAVDTLCKMFFNAFCIGFEVEEW